MGVIIKDIQRNNSEIIRIEVSEFKGRELINIRIWYSSIDNSTGDMVYKPTQKGVALNIAEFKELRDGIEKLGDYISDKEEGSTPEQFTEAVTENPEEDENETDKENKDENNEEKKDDSKDSE